MHVHFDGDILCFRCGFAAEKMEYTLSYDGGNTVEKYTYKKDLDARIANLGLGENESGLNYEVDKARVLEPLANALYNVKHIITNTLDAIGTSEYSVYLSGPENYRYGIATLQPYKGNRDPSQRPTYEEQIKQYMVDQWGAQFSDGEEADDVIGYTHYKQWLHDPLSTVIATVDKDLNMIPGLHYNFIKDESYDVSSVQADNFFYTQLLTGDPTDNIPGIPGIGQKRAAAALAKGKPWDVIRKLYENAYKADWRIILLEQARLLWIRRNPHEWFELPEGV